MSSKKVVEEENVFINGLNDGSLKIDIDKTKKLQKNVEKKLKKF